MSQENVERFMECVEAFNGMDIPGSLRLLDPAIQFDHRLSELQGSYSGLDGVKGFFADVAEHFDSLTVDCPDVRDLGDRVLALGTTHLTGKGSGVETELPFAVVAEFRGGRMTQFTDFGDRDQALEAARLGESSASQGNAELVRQVWKAVQESGLAAALDRSADWFADDCVFEDFPEMADRAAYVGHVGLRERTMHFAEIWGDFVMEPREFIEGGDRVVIAVVDMTGRGKGSGAPLDAQAFFVYEVDAGLIVRDRAFTSRSQALEAAGQAG